MDVWRRERREVSCLNNVGMRPAWEHRCQEVLKLGLSQMVEAFHFPASGERMAQILGRGLVWEGQRSALFPLDSVTLGGEHSVGRLGKAIYRREACSVARKAGYLCVKGN